LEFDLKKFEAPSLQRRRLRTQLAGGCGLHGLHGTGDECAHLV